MIDATPLPMLGRLVTKRMFPLEYAKRENTQPGALFLLFRHLTLIVYDLLTA